MRETLSERMQKYGFKNMGRLELFLWDLEIFLQIQSILGDRIVLKGGAAVQFYLPMEAQMEWGDRRKDEPFSLESIISDVYAQLDRYAAVDDGEDAELKKHIADFKGLYLNSRIEYAPQSVSCAALRIKMMYSLMINGHNWDSVKSAMQMENTLELAHLSGREKGAMVKELRTALVEGFSQYSSTPAKILKAKGLKIVFWAVAQPDNLDEIKNMIQSKLKA